MLLRGTAICDNSLKMVCLETPLTKICCSTRSPSARSHHDHVYATTQLVRLPANELKSRRSFVGSHFRGGKAQAGRPPRLSTANVRDLSSYESMFLFCNCFLFYFILIDRSQDRSRWRAGTSNKRVWLRRPEKAPGRCWWVFSHA